jgi:hypothetical protein
MERDKKCHKCGVTQIRHDGRAIEASIKLVEANAQHKGKTPRWPHKGDTGNHLSLRYSQAERGLEYWGPNGPDRHLLHNTVQGCLDFHEFLAELTRRGYDLSTLQLTVRRRPPKETDT